MARVIVLTDSDHLAEHLTPEADLRLAEEVSPEHLMDLDSSQKFLDRLEWAVLDAHGIRRGMTRIPEAAE